MDNLLKLLKQNSRLSDDHLAAMLGTTPEAVAKQIEEYEKSGTIKGYSTIIDDEVVNKDSVTAYIEIRITPQPNTGFDELANTIMKYDDVESVYLMSGDYDLGVMVKGNNIRDIADFVAQRLSALPGVLSASTHIVMKRYKDNGIYLSDNKVDERSSTTW